MTAPSRSLRYDADNARRRQVRAERRQIREASTARALQQEVSQANGSLHREIRVVCLPGGVRMALGALAGTDVAHPFVPDEATGTSCLACFGWCTDYRHWRPL